MLNPNIAAGEEVCTDVNFWAAVADKLMLSDEQINDLVSICALS
jgi:hypothetical protein